MNFRVCELRPVEAVARRGDRKDLGQDFKNVVLFHIRIVLRDAELLGRVCFLA